MYKTLKPYFKGTLIANGGLTADLAAYGIAN
jgi:hypothetical protein